MDSALNWGEIFFGIFLRKEAVLGKTNYGPFGFSRGPIYGQNMSEIVYSTCVAVWLIILESRT